VGPRRHFEWEVVRSRGERVSIHLARELREPNIGLLFLFEAPVQRFLVGGQVQLVGKGSRGPVGGDLVMLEPLCGGDETRVAKLVPLQHFDHFLAFIDQRLHCLVGVGSGASAVLLQDRLEALLVDLGRLLVLDEDILQVWIRSDFRHAQQALRELILTADQFLKLGKIHVLERRDLHRDSPFAHPVLEHHSPVRVQ
jgi:hypothetical protein